jgi:hypothetical protein
MTIPLAFIHRNQPTGLSRGRRAVFHALLGGLLVILGVHSASAGEDVQLEASILRVKPAVVLISSEVGAEVSVDCGTGPVHRVRPDPFYETGSGSLCTRTGSSRPTGMWSRASSK